MNVQHIMMEKKYTIFKENIQEIYQLKFKEKIEKKNGLIYGIFLNQKVLIKHQQKWTSKKEKAEKMQMALTLLWKNLQNGIKKIIKGNKHKKVRYKNKGRYKK